MNNHPGESKLLVLIEVRYHHGLYLPEIDLWLDPPGAKSRAFVSHAHADHFARHDMALCSTVTAALVQSRFRVAKERLQATDFHQMVEVEGYRLRLLPAGHIPGSTMLHATRLADGATLLYTGDFKVRRGRTAEEVVFQHADQLVMETTFGLPQFVFPPAIEVEAAVMRFVNGVLADGDTPVLLGYSLGKAQEALALLHAHGIPALLHPNVMEMTAACRDAGVPGLPEPELLTGAVPPGHAVIAPPNAVRSKVLRGISNRRVAMLSGWALLAGASFRYRVDEAIPLSDHADHHGLLECIQRVRPKRVLTVHGHTREFALELRARGIEAWSAMGNDQLELAGTVPARPVSPTNHAPTICRHSRPICPLADFTDVCRLVGETGSRLEKAEHLSRYLKSLGKAESLALAVRWLCGRPVAGVSERRAARAGSATLKRALFRIPGAREERYREISLSQNDSARTARLFMQELHLKPQPVTLEELADFFFQLSISSGSLHRIDLIASRLQTLHPAEGESLVKLLTGDLRIGLGEGLVEDAIAMASDIPAVDVRHAHMLTGDPGETACLARDGRLGDAKVRPFAPIKVMLASPVPDADTLVDAAGTGKPQLWLEPKYDGIRAQIHKQGHRAGLFSRDLRPLDSEFPELMTAALSIPDDFVLDGEIIAHADGRRLTFHDLQKRLGRLNTSQTDLFSRRDEGLSSLPPVRFVAFDLLYLNGKDLLCEPLEERRRSLETLSNLPVEIARIDVERTQPEVSAVNEAFRRARANGHEGLIVKDAFSIYVPGRRGRAWLKLKTSRSLDCVVVAVEQGHGRRAEVLSDYTFAVRDGSTDALRVIGKAYSGLTDGEIEELSDHFRRHTLSRERRKHHVEPDIVLEIAFDSLRFSKRHDSGLAMRFPRIHAIRRDKHLADIDTLEYARSLVDA